MPTSISHSFTGSILIAHSLFLLASAASQYRTIDDQFGDSATGDQIHYIDSWTQGANCSECFFRPQPDLAYLQTWHDTTKQSNDRAVGLQFNFVGSALSVHCIIPNAIVVSRASSDSRLRFVLDGQPVGSYNHTPDGSSQFIYNVTVYSVSSLASGSHNFSMIDDSTDAYSVILFDYAAYIFDDPETTTAPPPDTSVPSSKSSTSTSSAPQTANSSTTSSQTQTASQTLSTNGTIPLSTVSSSTNEIVPQPTTESASPSTSPQNRTGIVIGCVVASVVVTTLVIVLLLWRRRLRITTQMAPQTAAATRDDPYHIIPFDATSPTISSPSTPQTEKRIPNFGYTGTGTGSSIDYESDGNPRISEIRQLREAVATLQDRQDQILTVISPPPVYTSTLQ